MKPVLFARTSRVFTPEEEAALHDTLKRCSGATGAAAVQFQKTGDMTHVPAIIRGILERYVKTDLHGRLQRAPDDLLLSAHLGIDSLTMMEIVMLAEDVLQISIHNEDLRPLRTVGDVQRFIDCKLRGISWPQPTPRLAGSPDLAGIRWPTAQL